MPFQSGPDKKKQQPWPHGGRRAGSARARRHRGSLTSTCASRPQTELLLATSCFIGYLDRRPKGWKIPSKTTLLISWLQTRRPNPPYQPPGCVLRVPALGPGFFISYEHPYCTAGPRGCFLSIPPFPSILPFLHNVGPLGAES